MFAAVSTHEQRQSLRRGKECSYNYFGTLQKRNKSWGKRNRGCGSHTGMAASLRSRVNSLTLILMLLLCLSWWTAKVTRLPSFGDPTHGQPTSHVHWKQDLAYKVGFLDSSRFLWYLQVRGCNSLLATELLEGKSTSKPYKYRSPNVQWNPTVVLGFHFLLKNDLVLASVVD